MQNLDLYIKIVKIDTLMQPPSQIRHHKLSKKQYKFLKELCDNPHITFEKADKSSAVVCMNTSDYVHEIRH